MRNLPKHCRSQKNFSIYYQIYFLTFIKNLLFRVSLSISSKINFPFPRIVIISPEESDKISVAKDAKLILDIDEANLRQLLLENIKSYEDTVKALNEFLPFVDNWATCDIMSIKIFKKHLDILPEQLDIWLDSTHTYTIRFAIKMYMTYFLDDNFDISFMTKISKVSSDEYYVNMMLSWYFATALAKQYETAIKFLEEKKLSYWVHNKTIQKAIESYRITDEQKTYLRTLKRTGES